MNLPDKITLTDTQQNKWKHNLIVFLAPVGIIYLTSLVGVISQTNHVLAVKDIIPNTFTMGGITLYFINGALDYLKKLQA